MRYIVKNFAANERFGVYETPRAALTAWRAATRDVGCWFGVHLHPDEHRPGRYLSTPELEALANQVLEG